MARKENQNLELAIDTMDHMIDMANGHQHGGTLLSGDPGIGKTTFVEMLSSLLGVKSVVIEVPHVTEEHLINIPFVVYNGNTDQKTTGETHLKPDEYSMVLADSNLYSQLTSAPVMDDAGYLKHIQSPKTPAAVKDLYNQLGGTATQIPPAIQKARSRIRVILFLDEFYRSTTTRIRNIMRGMLNGKIGMHDIPANVYTIYASNMRDGGLDNTPNNAQFMEVDFQAANAKDWFTWFKTKYKDDKDIHLNEPVIDKFEQTLKDEHISYTDVATGIRTSPRRWEQLLLYINSAFPMESITDARALLTNVKNQFVHYKEGHYSDLAEKVISAVVDLIKQQANFDIKPADEYEKSEWRASLEHLIKAQIKTNGKRKHIPVVSGPPGIGKTFFVRDIAQQYNLRLVEEDIGRIFAEDAIGLPIPGDRRQGGMTVKFTVPMLYHKIMADIKRQDQHYMEDLIEKHGEQGAREQIDAYKKQQFKYLIFFDELNRTDEKTFNALRRVVLEKNFGPDKEGHNLELPKDALIVAAINPEGEGTEDLTDHFRDVIDVVPAEASWKKLRAHLMSRHQTEYSQEMNNVAMRIIEQFVAKFKDPHTKPDQAPFSLDIGGNHVYVSSREYTDMFQTLIRVTGRAIQEGIHDPDIKEDQLRDDVDYAVAKALKNSLRFPLRKAGVEPEEFLATLETWIQNLPGDVFGAMLTKKVSNLASLSGALTNYLNGKDLSQMPEDHHIVNTNNTFDNDKVMDEIKEALQSNITNDEGVEKYVLDKTHDKITCNGDKLVFNSSEKASLLENMALALLYTLHIHEFQHDRIGSIGTALNQTMSAVFKPLEKNQTLSKEVALKFKITVASLRMVLLKTSQSLQ